MSSYEYLEFISPHINKNQGLFLGGSVGENLIKGSDLKKVISNDVDIFYKDQAFANTFFKDIYKTSTYTIIEKGYRRYNKSFFVKGIEIKLNKGRFTEVVTPTRIYKINFVKLDELVCYEKVKYKNFELNIGLGVNLIGSKKFWTEQILNPQYLL